MKAKPRYLCKTCAVCLALVLATFSLRCSSGSEEVDPRDLANALAEEYEEWLNFENSTTADVPLPPENAGNFDFPQVSTITGPLTFTDTVTAGHEQEYGLMFNIDIQYSAGAAGLEQNVLAWVQQANKDSTAPQYYIIPVTAVGSGLTSLQATVTWNPRLSGNSFNILFAIQDENGDVGNYAYWNVVALPPSAEPATVVRQCQCSEDPHNVRWSPNANCVDSMTVDEFDNMRCGLWESSFHGLVFTGPTNNVEFPSGTRFSPYWVTDQASCELELSCEPAGQGQQAYQNLPAAKSLLQGMQFADADEVKFVAFGLPIPGRRSPILPEIYLQNPLDSMPYFDLSYDSPNVYDGFLLYATPADWGSDSADSGGYLEVCLVDPFMGSGMYSFSVNAPSAAGRTFFVELILYNDQEYTPVGSFTLITPPNEHTTLQQCPCTSQTLSYSGPPDSGMDPSSNCSSFTSALGLNDLAVFPHGTHHESMSSYGLFTYGLDCTGYSSY